MQFRFLWKLFAVDGEANVVAREKYFFRKLFLVAKKLFVVVRDDNAIFQIEIIFAVATCGC